MSNLIKAVINIINNAQLVIEHITSGNNRATNMGDGLENFIKNAFSDTLNEVNEKIKLEKISKTFSYTGNKTNPPDMILWNGDAIEVKKIESVNTSLQLNSSHPKSKLHASNSKINKTCRECEKWDEKDLIYSIGYVENKALQSLWLIYGDCYVADFETYQKVEKTITTSLENLEDLEINHDTNELSGIRNVDPLNITYLRIRGMWIIENPNKVFDYIYEYDKKATFQLVSLMMKSKYDSFPAEDLNRLSSNDKIVIQDVKIKNPNNPANLLDAKLIVFKIQS